MLQDAEDDDSASMAEGGSQAEASGDALTLSSHSDLRHRPEHAELPEEEIAAPVVSLLKRATSLDFENRTFGDDDDTGGGQESQQKDVALNAGKSGTADALDDEYVVPLGQLSLERRSLIDDDDEESFMDGDSQQEPTADYLSLSSDECNLEPRRHRPEHAQLPEQECQVPVVSLLKRGTSLDMENREIIRAKLPERASGSKGAKHVKRRHRARVDSSEDDDDDEDSFMEGDINQEPIMRQLSVSSEEFEPRRHHPEHAELPQAVELAVPVVSVLRRGTSLDIENPDFGEDAAVGKKDQEKSPRLPTALTEDEESSEFEDEESFMDGDSQQQPMMQELSVSSNEMEPRRHRPEHAELPRQILLSPVASTLNRRTSLDLELRDVLGAAGPELLEAVALMDGSGDIVLKAGESPSKKKTYKQFVVNTGYEDSFCDGDSQDAALEILSISTISDEPRRHRPEEAELPQDQHKELTSSSRHRSETLDFENHCGSDSSLQPLPGD